MTLKELTSDAAVVGTAVQDLLDKHATLDVVAAAEADGWAPSLWDAMHHNGFTTVSVGEHVGGSGGSLADADAVLEQVGRHSAPVPVAESSLLGGWLLESVKESLPAGMVTTAPAEGITVSPLGRLDGVVHRLPWASQADKIALLVGAQEQRLVLLDPSECSIERGTNIAGEPRDALVLRDVPAALLPVPAEVTAKALVLRGALSRVALISGAAARALEITVQYTQDRHQFGRPVARFQAVQAHLVTMAEQVEIIRIAARTAALNAATSGALDPFDVAAAKIVASQAAGVVASHAHQATGAMGMTREYELGYLTRRLWSWRDEYGSENYWARRLGSQLAQLDGPSIWPAIAQGLRSA